MIFNSKMNYPRKNRGFTLIELLVVISIISLLSSVILASVASARANADKTAFAQSLFSAQTALEIYKAATGYYPYENTSSIQAFMRLNNSSGGMSIDDMSSAFTSITPPFTPTYMRSFPLPFKGTGNLITYGNPGYITIFSNGSGIYKCGSKPLKGYLLYIYDQVGVTAGVDSKYPLPRASDVNGVKLNNYSYCLTAN